VTASTPEGTPVAGPQTPQPGATAPSGAPSGGPSGAPSGGPSGAPSGGVLTPAQLSLLGAILDRLVPAEGDLPGAGALGGAGEIDAILGARPALRPTLLEALRAIEAQGDFLALSPEQQDDALRAAERAAKGPFRALVRQAYSAYYSHPAVLRAVGYGLPSSPPSGPPSGPQPAGFPQITQTPFDESRLDAVRQRGPLWREA
jgi:Gluconate 2-dehydrogenase subunit 3